MSEEDAPRRGEVWDLDLGDPIGHEAAFLRPALVVSANRFNVHRLVAVCPIGRTRKLYPTRVPILVGRSGLDVDSFVQVEQVRTVSTDRLVQRRGSASRTELGDVARILRLLLDL